MSDVQLIPIQYGEYKIIPMKAFNGILWSVSISDTDCWTDVDLGKLLKRINLLRSSFQ